MKNVERMEKVLEIASFPRAILTRGLGQGKGWFFLACSPFTLEWLTVLNYYRFLTKIRYDPPDLCRHPVSCQQVKFCSHLKPPYGAYGGLFRWLKQQKKNVFN